MDKSPEGGQDRAPVHLQDMGERLSPQGPHPSHPHLPPHQELCLQELPPTEFWGQGHPPWALRDCYRASS